MPTESKRLPPPYRVNAIGLLLTLRCDAECSHCCFECGPRRREQMSRRQVLDYVGQIAATGKIKAVNLTGGEVFAAYGLLRATVEAAGRHGMRSHIVTNGNWATSPKRAREKLQPLVDAGLKNIVLSFDAVHEHYVKPERVRHALEVAHAMGIELALEHTSLEDPRGETVEVLFNSLGLPQGLPVVVTQCQISPGGRAIRNYPPELMTLVDGDSEAGERLHAPCRFVVRMPMITPNGDVAACCGVTVTTATGFREEFVVGNLNEQSLAELLEILEYDPLCTALMVEGPWYFYQPISKQYPELFPRKRFLNICDLCAQMVLNERVKAKMQEMLKQQELPLLVKKMMLQLACEEKLDASQLA